MKWFYDFEQEKYISETQLKTEYNNLKTEYPEQYNYSFAHYKMNCLSINNGSLFTMERRKSELQKKLFFLSLETIEDGFDNSKEIDSIEKELAYIETLKTEE